jgi:hypothetical protein
MILGHYLITSPPHQLSYDFIVARLRPVRTYCVLSGAISTEYLKFEEHTKVPHFTAELCKVRRRNWHLQT